MNKESESVFDRLWAAVKAGHVGARYWAYEILFRAGQQDEATPYFIESLKEDEYWATALADLFLQYGQTPALLLAEHAHRMFCEQECPGYLRLAALHPDTQGILWEALNTPAQATALQLLIAQHADVVAVCTKILEESNSPHTLRVATEHLRNSDPAAVSQFCQTRGWAWGSLIDICRRNNVSENVDSR